MWGSDATKVCCLVRRGGGRVGGGRFGEVFLLLGMGEARDRLLGSWMATSSLAELLKMPDQEEFLGGGAGGSREGGARVVAGAAEVEGE